MYTYINHIKHTEEIKQETPATKALFMDAHILLILVKNKAGYFD